MKMVLIPAYNSVNTIAEVILKAKVGVDEVVVYDDGSTDDTVFIARGCGAKVIEGKVNRGKGYALMRLFEYAKRFSPDVVVTIDSDMQHNPNEIFEVMRPILVNRADVVLGVRTDIPVFYRRIGNKIFDSLGRQKGSQCGFRAYNMKALEKIKITKFGYSADSEIFSQVKDLRIKEVFVSVKYDKYSHKKNPFSHFIQVFNFIFLKRPLLNLGILGVIGFSFGIMGMIDVVKLWQINQELAVGKLLFYMTVLLLGALTFFVGLILHVIRSEKND